MRAKLIREIPQPEGLPYYFRRYEFECIDCGRIYHNGRCDERTNPYCGACRRKHDNERLKERAKEKEQAKIDAVLEDIKAEIKELHKSHMIHFVSADGAVDTCLEIIDRHISGKDKE